MATRHKSDRRQEGFTRASSEAAAEAGGGGGGGGGGAHPALGDLLSATSCSYSCMRSRMPSACVAGAWARKGPKLKVLTGLDTRHAARPQEG
jgi:hypothetical protein